MLTIEKYLTNSGDLSDKYSLMKHRVRTIEYEHTAAGFPEGNNHGWGHIARVLEYLDFLLGPNPLNYINDYELFLSMMSILYHDIGLLRQRKDHADISKKLLEDDDQDAYIVNTRDKEIIKVAVVSHSSSKDIEEECAHLNNKEVIGGREARPKVICALVRLSDELDEDFRRADPILQKRMGIPDSNFYWKYCQRISGIRPRPDKKQIDVNAGLEANDLLLQNDDGTTFFNFFAQKLEKLNSERMIVNKFLPDELQYGSILISMKPIANYSKSPKPTKFRFDDYTSKSEFLSRYRELTEVRTNQDPGSPKAPGKSSEEVGRQLESEDEKGMDELVTESEKAKRVNILSQLTTGEAKIIKSLFETPIHRLDDGGVHVDSIWGAHLYVLFDGSNVLDIDRGVVIGNNIHSARDSFSRPQHLIDISSLGMRLKEVRTEIEHLITLGLIELSECQILYRRFAHFPPNLLKSLDRGFAKLVSSSLQFIEYKGLMEMAEPRVI